MLEGIERLVDLTGVSVSALSGLDADGIKAAIGRNDADALAQTAGHFAGTARDGNTVRMARTVAIPLRYFVAKMFHGPFLVVAEARWTRSTTGASGRRSGGSSTRSTRAWFRRTTSRVHRADRLPRPGPRLQSLLESGRRAGSADISEAGAGYVGAAYEATKGWLASLPAGEAVGVGFSGGIDSLSVLLLARKAMADLGRDPDQIRAFTLDFGNGPDALQAERIVKDLGIERTPGSASFVPDPSEYNLREAIT